MRIFILFLLAITFSNEANSKDHHKGLISSINLGARYSSLIERRGVILYKDIQLDPVVAIFLFDDKLEFLGDSIGYRDFVYSDQLRIRSRLLTLTDKPLFPKNDNIYKNSIHRKDTYEWSNTLELFLPAYNEKYLAEIDLTFNKDLSAHHGYYGELQSKLKLFSFDIPLSHIQVEPNLYSSIGWGDTKHNHYLYGSSGGDAPQFNNFSYGLWFAFPDEADRFYPIIQLKHFQTISDVTNDSSQGWLVSFIASFGVLE